MVRTYHLVATAGEEDRREGGGGGAEAGNETVELDAAQVARGQSAGGGLTREAIGDDDVWMNRRQGIERMTSRDRTHAFGVRQGR